MAMSFSVSVIQGKFAKSKIRLPARDNLVFANPKMRFKELGILGLIFPKICIIYSQNVTDFSLLF